MPFNYESDVFINNLPNDGQQELRKEDRLRGLYEINASIDNLENEVMKAVSYSDGKVFTSNIDFPSGEGILVDVASAGICGSDLHILNSGAHSPHVAGHEIAGITSDGTHVAIEPII